MAILLPFYLAIGDQDDVCAFKRVVTEILDKDQLASKVQYIILATLEIHKIGPGVYDLANTTQWL